MCHKMVQPNSTVQGDPTRPTRDLPDMYVPPSIDAQPSDTVLSSHSLRVVETNPRTDSRWESFVVDHPNGSIYHHPAWLEALEREYGQQGVYFVCENAAGQVLAILPTLYTRGLPFNFGGPLTGRRLSSLPRTPVAGPLSIDSRATVAIVEAAVRRASRKAGVRLQIKMQGPELDGLVDGLVCTPWRLSYVLHLADGPEEPFRIGSSSRNRASINRAVNKAARLGVRVRAAEDNRWLHLSVVRPDHLLRFQWFRTQRSLFTA